ncbi:tol-pal system-associated acyl-CoA thioesterase [Salipiger bermudensis]|uniref:Putative thioesterase n=1 Tax=Salipiger bermudensis (strain DSM 26914 / JCM 13377 / KCTC 12554 / HTCC2601) TaxID=314265 RepID=Q0FL84_SALBH|nr:tol-pal system-associated acyl-CoA thioesterase [Salipiger bermudensis]MAE89264.1 tol-pal system-associated acyl-CoA thioesterase [Pelagibaca sp.]MBR9890930.1 tol-pal system-associated acyl-CoA thioesterase [bacterium]EAU44987.1 Putative thioesterase [Salipiger bermudensis HTCC2601]MBN9676281.1 tol-pal system-associated acyl-CoA thioesterase [Salipiger bermudensis]MCA1285414.1 tol-pal system-associated acyl-CoA thioesterase [Salipiger bermudensis]
MQHEFPVRVYYEDTDMAGIVYHANYLKFIERARSEWVKGMGIDQNALREHEGVVFVIRRIEADFRASARFDDELVVQTRVQSVSGVRLVLHQEVQRAGEALFTAEVTLVSMTLDGQPTRLPQELRRKVH